MADQTVPDPVLAAQARAEQALLAAERVLSSDDATNDQEHDALTALVEAMPGVLAICQSWHDVSAALDRNGNGPLSAGDVCTIGFAEQKSLRAGLTLEAGEQVSR